METEAQLRACRVASSPLLRVAWALCGLVLASRAMADGNAPWFATSVRTPITQMDGAVPPRAAPVSAHWVALAPAGMQAEIAAVQTPDGIAVYGRAAGEAGEWTLRWSTLRQLELPPIGWQRANRPLLSDADCQHLGLSPQDLAYCPQWRQTQEAHRARIRQAFTPAYRIQAARGEPVVLEPWNVPALTNAWDGPVASFAEIDPAPAGPLHTWSDNERAGFTLMIPWTAWPLSAEHHLRTLYLQASHCPPQAPCVHAPAPDGALELVLSTPLTLSPDPCGQSLGYSPNDEHWYLRITDSLPGAQPDATSAYAFVNPGGGYLDRPDPNRISPELWSHAYRTSSVAIPGEPWQWDICLPDWRLRRDTEPSIAATMLSPTQSAQIEGDPDAAPWPARRHPYWNNEQPEFVETRGTDGEFETRKLDADRLILLQAYRLKAPVSGEGHNGACDTADFAVWILDSQAPSLRQALVLSDYGPDLCAGSGLISAELSADGRYVDSVRRKYDTEELTTTGVLEIRERFCLDDVSNSYLRCRHERYTQCSSEGCPAETPTEAN